MEREVIGVGVLVLMAGAWSGCASSRIDVHEPRGVTRGEPAASGGSAAVEGVSAAALERADLGGAAVEQVGAEGGVGAYLELGAARNLRLKAAYERWRAATARIAQATSLMDPMLSYGRFLNEFSSRQSMGQHEFELMQTFPWFGKLALRGDAASSEAAMAAREYESVRLALFRDIRVALHDLYLLGREVELTKENLALVAQFEAIARTRFQVATGTHADVVRAQVEIGRLEDRVRELDRMRPTVLARLNFALSRPAGEEAGAPGTLAQEKLDADAGGVMALLRAHSPRLAGMDEEVERQRVMTELARKEYWPDVSVGAMYMVDGEDPAQVRVSVNVPLWRARLDAGVREANAMRLAAAYERADEENMLFAELHEALFSHDDAQRRLELYTRTLLPKAEESVRASLGAFQAGTGSFLELIDAERTLLEFQLSLARAETERATALARLDALVGTRVPRIGDDAARQGGER